STWKDITWNHHNDTLPGTSIHPSYKKSKSMFEAVLAGDRQRIDDAARKLAPSTPGDPGILVVNSLPYPRREWVEFDMSHELFERAYRCFPIDPLPETSDGKTDRVGRVVDVPALGYRWISLPTKGHSPWPSHMLASRSRLESNEMR